MSNKKILLVGDGNHQFIINLAKELKKFKKELFIGIISHTAVKKDNSVFYDSIISPFKSSPYELIFSKIKYVRSFFKRTYYYIKRSDIRSYHVINFHYLTSDSFALTDIIRKKFNGQIIFSVWGSDMYKIKAGHKQEFKKNTAKADSITFTNEKSIDYFKKEFQVKNLNIQLCRFGLAPLENLKNLSLPKYECKEALKWNPEKLAVMVGYNLAPGQQHLKILDQLNTNDVLKLKEKIQIILPITYGGSQSYKAEIVKKMEQLPFEYKIYDQFLQDETIAKIRKATDIMIQLQKTDQFSGSMQEHLYARNVVITGKWLPYDSLKKEGAWFLELNRIEELKFTLPEVIKNYHNYEAKTVDSPSAISTLSSWENNIKMWANLYSI